MIPEDLIDGDALPEEYYSKLMDTGNVTKDWILLSSPFPVIIILTSYLLLILKIGPQFMKERPSYGLTTIIRLYNIFQVLINGHMLFAGLVIHPDAFVSVLKNSCTTYDPGTYEHLKQAYLKYGYMFLFVKVVDLLDTIFMVLRKKYSHITFLHVYHHTAIVFFTWLNLSYSKPLHAVFPVTFNILIHVIMYSYYFLSTFPKFKKYLCWKRQLTKLQMLQFVFTFVYLSLFYFNGCPISRVFTFTGIFNAIIFFILFLNYYLKTYILESGRKIVHNNQDKDL